MKAEKPNSYQSYQDYHLKKRGLKPPQADPHSLVGKDKSDKIDISEKAKNLGEKLKNQALSQSNLATSLISKVTSLPLPSPLSVGSSDKEPEKKVEVEEKKEQEDKKVDLKKIEKVKVTKDRGVIKRPALFFITGFESLSTSTDYDGLRNMAENLTGARIYSWDQKDEMTNEILKRAVDQKIILVGHSLGGDTAVEIANQLNRVENGFKTVDLLVTIDSVGQNNDIIPQNVSKNLNFFGETSFFFNDGPNVARNNEMTKVINELRPEGHTELDNLSEIQYTIVRNIKEALA